MNSISCSVFSGLCLALKLGLFCSFLTLLSFSHDGNGHSEFILVAKADVLENGALILCG